MRGEWSGEDRAEGAHFPRGGGEARRRGGEEARSGAGEKATPGPAHARAQCERVVGALGTCIVRPHSAVGWTRTRTRTR